MHYNLYKCVFPLEIYTSKTFDHTYVVILLFMLSRSDNTAWQQGVDLISIARQSKLLFSTGEIIDIKQTIKERQWVSFADWKKFHTYNKDCYPSGAQ